VAAVKQIAGGGKGAGEGPSTAACLSLVAT